LGLDDQIRATQGGHQWSATEKKEKDKKKEKREKTWGGQATGEN